MKWRLCFGHMVTIWQHLWSLSFPSAFDVRCPHSIPACLTTTARAYLTQKYVKILFPDVLLRGILQLCCWQNVVYSANLQQLNIVSRVQSLTVPGSIICNTTDPTGSHPLNNISNDGCNTSIPIVMDPCPMLATKDVIDMEESVQLGQENHDENWGLMWASQVVEVFVSVGLPWALEWQALSWLPPPSTSGWLYVHDQPLNYHYTV